MGLSIIIPAYNEEQNIPLLHRQIKKAIKNLDYEIIFVNDGSTDNTKEELGKIKNSKVKIVNLPKRRGKSYALNTGFGNARYNIIATLDADLQNNPGDILKLLDKLDRGYDLVCGYRYKRNESIFKKISSRIGNYINNKIFDFPLNDNNCPLKVFKKKCIENIIFSRNVHRFIPILAKIQGYKVGEEKVGHYPRIYGKSKYGIHNRILGNLKTLVMIKLKKENLIRKKNGKNIKAN